jgi:AraC-like DNA-binding protein
VNDGPLAADALRNAVSEPGEQIAVRFMRSTLLELAVVWATQQHRRLSERCPARPCAVKALADVGLFWPTRSDQRASDLFVRHVTAVRDELVSTHGAPLAHQAASLFEKKRGLMTVEAAAKALGTHTSTLRRAFQREMAMSPREYLMRVRMAHAQKLLADSPHAKVEPIAYEVGWSSKSGLYRAFKRFRGQTPGHGRHVRVRTL